MWWSVLLLGVLLSKEGRAQPAETWDEPVLRALAASPAVQTVELWSGDGRNLGRFRALELQELLAAAPERESSVVLRVQAADGQTVLLSGGELRMAAIPPLLLLERPRGRLSDTVRLWVGRAQQLPLEQADAALQPAVVRRYRMLTRVERPRRLGLPALVVGTDRRPERWVERVRRIELWHVPPACP